MSLAGKLDDLRLPELLQVLALGGKSGKLTLTCADGFGLIVVRRGKIIYSVCNGVRETFGHILMCRGLLDEKTLARALERQGRSRTERRLGAILIEMGALDAATVESVMVEQTSKVVGELASWPGGFFRFDQAEVPDHGEVEVDARDFLMSEGVDGEQVAINVLAQSADLDQAASAEQPGPAASLGAILGDVRTPAFVGEATRSFLRSAAALVDRGVVFAVRRRELVGLGQFGLGGDAEPPDSRVRRLALPLGEPSVLASAASRRSSYLGPIEDTPWNRRLWQQLGGGRPEEVVAVPIVAEDAVAAVFYGDNAISGTRITRAEDLDLLAIEAGAALSRRRHASPAPGRGHGVR